MIARRYGTAALLAFVAACGTDSGERTVVDSAGISIVTSSAPVWGDAPAWTVDSTPITRIGDAADSGAALLIGITGVRLLGDGRVAVVSNDEKAVLYFDPQRRPMGRTGRAGNGPGEFRQVVLVASTRDSLLLWDYELDRATMIDPGGRVDRTFPFAAPDSASQYGFAPAAQFDDGSILVAGRIGATIGQASGARRDPVPLARASATGAVEQALATIPGNEQLVVSTSQYVSAMERPFGRRSVIGTSGSRTLVATGDRDEVMVLGRGGQVEALWRIQRAPRAIDAGDLETQAARQRAQAQQLPAAFASAMLATIDSAGVPTALPPYDQLIVDETGATWLRDDAGPIRRDTVAGRWTVFDRKGRWLGAVVTPPRLVIHQITRDRVVGVWTDQDGVEQVRVHPLRR